MESIKNSPKSDFPDILQECMDYGFLDDLELAQLFKIDVTELEEVMSDPEIMDKKTWSAHANALYKYLVKENKKYKIIYYKHN